MFGQEFVRVQGRKFKRPGPYYQWGGGSGILRHDKDGVWRVYNVANPRIYYTLVRPFVKYLSLGRFRNKNVTVEGWVTPYQWNYPNFNIIPRVVRR